MEFRVASIASHSWGFSCFSIVDASLGLSLTGKNQSGGKSVKSTFGWDSCTWRAWNEKCDKESTESTLECAYCYKLRDAQRCSKISIDQPGKESSMKRIKEPQTAMFPTLVWKSSDFTVRLLGAPCGWQSPNVHLIQRIIGQVSICWNSVLMYRTHEPDLQWKGRRYKLHPENQSGGISRKAGCRLWHGFSDWIVRFFFAQKSASLSKHKKTWRNPSETFETLPLEAA